MAPKPEGSEVLTKVPPPRREDRIQHALWVGRVLRGSADPFDDAKEQRRVERAYDRSYYPTGTGRQLVAILAAASRVDRLGRVKVPTLVIHGTEDVLVPVENGRIVAAAVPGARLIEYEGMGHNLPERLWPEVLDAIEELARQATALQSR